MAVIPIKGTVGNDDLSGTAGGDIFRLRQGGDDTASGLAGDDTFYMGGAFNALDAIDGGADNDRVVLDGDYASGVIFGAATMTNVEALRLGGAFDYSLTTHDATVAAGARLTVNAANITGGHELTFDGSAELDGHFTIFGSAGNDILTGGAKGDRFNLANGGIDTVHGGGGKDVFILGATLTASDTIEGGTGEDTLILNGNYGDFEDLYAFSASAMTNVETLVLTGGHIYGLAMNNANVAAGEMLTVDATAGTVYFHGQVETDGAFHVIGNGGDVALTGAGNDIFDFLTGASFAVQAGGGDDILNVGTNWPGTHLTTPSFYGGNDTDTLTFDGDYAAMILHGNEIRLVENLVFHGGHSYTGVELIADITRYVGTGTSGTVTIDASELGASEVLEIDVTAATSAGYAITGGAGDDIFAMGALRATESLEGGAGFDTVTFTDMVENASDTLEFSATTLVGIDRLEAAADVSLDLRTIDANVAAGATLEVDMSALAINALSWNGIAETDGHFDITSGGASGGITAGALSDTITMSAHTGSYYLQGGGGADTIACNTGTEQLLYNGVGSSNSTAYDTVTGFNADVDKFDLPVAVGTVFFASRAVSAATFDADMGSAISDSVCYVVTASGGDLIGHVFLFVEGASNGGYQAGQDYIFDITGYSGTLNSGDFI